MTGSIFVEQLKRSWQSILYWGLGLAFLGFLMGAIIQDLDMLNNYKELLDAFPPALLNAIGLNDAASLATPEGFLGFGFFTYGILVLAVFAITAGLGITSNEEDDGTINILLALPVARWRVIVEKYAAYIIVIAAIAALSFVGLYVGQAISPMSVSTDHLLTGTINMIPTTLAMLTITVFVASVFSRKLIASGIASAVVIGSYILYVVANAVDNAIIDAAGQLSVFRYYDSEHVMQTGLDSSNIAILLGASLVLLLVSLFAFERRDVGG